MVVTEECMVVDDVFVVVVSDATYGDESGW